MFLIGRVSIRNAQRNDEVEDVNDVKEVEEKSVLSLCAHTARRCRYRRAFRQIQFLTHKSRFSVTGCGEFLTCTNGQKWYRSEVQSGK